VAGRAAGPSSTKAAPEGPSSTGGHSTRRCCIREGGKRCLPRGPNFDETCVACKIRTNSRKGGHRRRRPAKQLVCKPRTPGPRRRVRSAQAGRAGAQTSTMPAYIYHLYSVFYNFVGSADRPKYAIIVGREAALDIINLCGFKLLGTVSHPSAALALMAQFKFYPAHEYLYRAGKHEFRTPGKSSRMP
jgi:hypothetical protein